MQDHEHPQGTQRSRYRYAFTVKHHGGGPSDAARWSPLVTEDEEFSVFNTADLHDLSDDRKWLYGVLSDDKGGLRDLGTWYQQVAEFPFAKEGRAWHGYPLWTVSEIAPQNRRGEKYRPARQVFDKMLAAGLITRKQRIRLLKGDYA